MRRAARRMASSLALAIGLPLAAGCAGMGLEDLLGGMALGGDVRGEVDWVDERSREIGVSSGWGGRQTVRYDSRTDVIYGQRRYDVRDLERGDVVSIDVDEDSRGRRRARTIRVERSVRDSRDGRSSGRIERFDGRVTWVDVDRGQFGVELGRGEYDVSLPYQASRSTVDRMRRLRRGNRVRFEGEMYGEGRIGLRRFL